MKLLITLKRIEDYTDQFPHKIIILTLFQSSLLLSLHHMYHNIQLNFLDLSQNNPKLIQIITRQIHRTIIVGINAPLPPPTVADSLVKAQYEEGGKLTKNGGR